MLFLVVISHKQMGVVWNGVGTTMWCSRLRNSLNVLRVENSSVLAKLLQIITHQKLYRKLTAKSF